MGSYRDLKHTDMSEIDVMTLNWAIHRLNGVSSPANAAYSAQELTHQLKNSGSRVLFTCLPLLPIASEAAANSGIPRHRIYICELPKQVTAGVQPTGEFKTLEQLIKLGASLPSLEAIKWEVGQGARQTAFLCYSSGTSGLPVYSLIHNGSYSLSANVSPSSRKVS